MAHSILRKIENGDAISREEFCASCRSLIWLCGRDLGLDQQEQQKLLTKVVSGFFSTEGIFVHNGAHGRFRDCFRQLVYRNAKMILDQRSQLGKAWIELRTLSEETDETENKGS